VEGLTVADFVGFERQKGHADCFRPCDYRVDFHPKLVLTIIARDEQVEGILNAVAGGARTGKIGDGKMFVTAVEEVVRIRTGEIDKAAVQGALPRADFELVEIGGALSSSLPLKSSQRRKKNGRRTRPRIRRVMTLGMIA
jgi:nitrogen regulatory protein P-II 1